MHMPANAHGSEQARMESIHSGRAETLALAPGVRLREFASFRCSAEGFSTGIAEFDPGALLAYHKHSFSEAITILSGEARVFVEGRAHHLSAFDCIHAPAGVAHSVANGAEAGSMLALSAFASATPTRDFVEDRFAPEERGRANPEVDDPEHIVRFRQAEMYELSPGTLFCDLFAGRFGSVGICGGYGRFQSGASLPCHIHQFDESITIVQGEALCLVQGAGYRLSGCDTAFVPRGRPHRFVNQSPSMMAMIWVYAGSEPERTIVEAGYCDGSLCWPGPDLSRP